MPSSLTARHIRPYGNPIGQVTADGSGNWSFTPSTPLADGTVVNATATDPAGNTSGQGSTTVDGVAPTTPTVNLSNGSSLSGTAEPGSTVILTDGNGNPIAEVTADGSGNPIGQVTADGSGNWSFTPTTPLPNGTVVNATATDASGNTSAGSSVTVDSVAPATPVINPSNGTTLSGTAEPGSSVTLTDGNGNPIGQVTADGSGNWSSGAFMTTGGVARRLIDFANACVGHIRGGLAIAAVLACMLFAALSGSSPATVAAVGSIAIAGMVRSGYPQAFGAGIVCNAGTLGILIPPSIVMVVYAAAKKPISRSVSTRLRLAIGTPTRISACPL